VKVHVSRLLKKGARPLLYPPIRGCRKALPSDRLDQHLEYSRSGSGFQHPVRRLLTRLLALLLSLSLAFTPVAFAQNNPPPPRPAFTQQELDQMLAPIALYPDALLSQILMASTYPLEVVEAARWSRANPGLKGDDAVRAVQQYNWDPSVQSLVAFPQVLSTMDEKLDWTGRLGDAFLDQQSQVMDTVQNLRQRAYAGGNLASTDQLRVYPEGQTIVVEPANPELVYVPYYDPMVVYGSWWWPAYPPVYWAPWPGYYRGPGLALGFAWGAGIGVSLDFFFGGWDWHRHTINVVNVNNYYYRGAHAGRGPGAPHEWEHDPAHRGGVPYREAAPRQKYGRASASPEGRRDFRGFDVSPSGNRAVPANRPDGRTGDVRPNTGAVPNRSPVPGPANRPETPRARLGRPVSGQRPSAYEGIGSAAEVRGFSARGHASSQPIAPAHSGAPAPGSSGNVSAPRPSAPPRTGSAPHPSGGGAARHR